MHYYQFNIADYRKHTGHLTPVEHYIYRWLIDEYHMSEKPINNDVIKLLRRISLDETHRNSLELILEEFFTPACDDNYKAVNISEHPEYANIGEYPELCQYWVHLRAEEDIADYKKLIENKSAAGKASAKARKTKNNNSSTHVKQKPTGEQLTSNYKPVTNNHKDLVEKKLLDILNSRSGKKFKPVESNLKFLRARLKEGHTEKDITDVIERKILEWQNDPGMKQYIRPATLFNAEKFNQYIGEIGEPLPENEKTKQPWEFVPCEDNKLVNWAKEHGYSKPGPSASYNEYRGKLNIEVERRQMQERNQ